MTPAARHPWAGARIAPDDRVAAAAVVAALVIVIGTFLPWLRSGEVWRNSYAVWQSADRLGVVSGLALEIVHLLWFLVPVAAGLVLLTHALRCPRAAAAIALPLAAIPSIGAVLVIQGPLPAGAGVAVTLVGALLLAATTMIGLRRRPATPPGRP